MIISTVTFTGADDSVDPKDLIALSREYPKIEWGILFGSQQGTPRFPSIDWLNRLMEQVHLADFDVNLSAHLCGKYVRDLVLRGDFSWYGQWAYFQRLQLNFHGRFHEGCEAFYDMLPGLDYKVIAQCDGVNDGMVRYLSENEIVTPLFDRSGGAGVVPDEWPEVWPGVYCGYAGGLGPDNILTELERIDSKVRDANIWIDMERKVRSSEITFNLNAVQAAMREIPSEFLHPEDYKYERG